MKPLLIVLQITSLLSAGVYVPPRVVVFVGDSITENWGRRATLPGFVSVNEGVTGQTTTQILTRFNSDVLAQQPDMIVLLAGTNDIYLSVPDAVTKANIEQMVTMSEAQHVKVVLCSLLPTTPDWYDLRPPERIVALNDWLRTYAAEHGLVYADYYSRFVGRIAALTVDGLHPNAAGYDVMRDVLQGVH